MQHLEGSGTPVLHIEDARFLKVKQKLKKLGLILFASLYTLAVGCGHRTSGSTKG